MAESSGVEQLLLQMSVQIWERQEPRETGLTDERNCKGQPIALMQSATTANLPLYNYVRGPL